MAENGNKHYYLLYGKRKGRFSQKSGTSSRHKTVQQKKKYYDNDNNNNKVKFSLKGCCVALLVGYMTA